MKRLILPYLSVAFCLIAFQHSYSQVTKSQLVDSYSWVGADDANARIEVWRNEALKTPNSIGYVIIYGGKFSKKGEIDAHIKGIKAGFKFIRFDESKVVFIKGGFREKLEVDFWVVPQNACPPLPTPTIDVEKVKFKGVSRKYIPYLCCD